MRTKVKLEIKGIKRLESEINKVPISAIVVTGPEEED